MAKTEFYQTVKSVPISGYTHDRIQRVKVSSPKGIPFGEGHIPTFSIISTNGVLGEQSGIDGRLVKISDWHNRSYEMRFGETPRVYFTDEYGNVFGTLTTKGNNLHNPEILRSSTAPSGYIIWGLQDSDAMVRILRVSRLLRSKHIDTEYIIRAIEPLELPVDGEMFPLSAFKDRLVQKLWDKNATKDSVDERGEESIPREEAPQVRLALESMTFFNTIRALQVGERFMDLDMVESSEDLILMMRKVFSYVNFTEELKAKRNKRYKSKHFDPEKITDVYRYFADYLSRNLAKNYAKLHNLGLVHVFPYTGNVSLIGAICDVDSVKGVVAGCGDDPITQDDIAKDLDTLLNGYEEDRGIIDVLNRIQRVFLVRYGDNLGKRFRDTFAHHYLSKIRSDDILDSVALLAAVYDYSQTEDKEQLSLHLQMVISELGWDFERNLLSGNDLETFFSARKDHLTKMLDFASEMVHLNGEELENATYRAQQDGLLVPISQQFASFTVDRLKGPIKMTFGDDYEALVEKYGERAAEAVVTMFAVREYHKIISKLSDNALIDRFDEFKQEYVRSKEWEADIVSHIIEIDVLFDTPSMRDYYLSLISTQVGLDYHYSEAIEQFVASYYGYNRLDDDLRQSLLDNLYAIDNVDEATLQYLEEVLGTEEYIRNTLRESFEFDIQHAIKENITVKIGEGLIGISQIYGDNAGRLVIDFFTDRETRKILERMSDEDWERLEQRVRQYHKGIAQRAFEEYQNREAPVAQK